MQFSITVKNGVITEVNGTCYFTDVAKAMALAILGEKRFPEWEYQARKVLGIVTDANSFDTLINTSLPATATHVYNTIVTLEGVFSEFQKQYQVPEVLDNGVYDVFEVAILIATKASRRR